MCSGVYAGRLHALNLVTKAGHLIRGQILYSVLVGIDPPEVPEQQQLMLHANSEDRPFTRFSGNNAAIINFQFRTRFSFFLTLLLQSSNLRSGFGHLLYPHPPPPPARAFG